MWRDREEGKRSCAEIRVSSRRLKEGFRVVSLFWGDIVGILRGGRKKGIGGLRGGEKRKVRCGRESGGREGERECMALFRRIVL